MDEWHAIPIRSPSLAQTHTVAHLWSIYPLSNDLLLADGSEAVVTIAYGPC